MLKYSIYYQELDIYNGMKHVSVYADQIKLFVIIKNAGIKINADVNVKN